MSQYLWLFLSHNLDFWNMNNNFICITLNMNIFMYTFDVGSVASNGALLFCTYQKRQFLNTTSTSSSSLTFLMADCKQMEKTDSTQPIRDTRVNLKRKSSVIVVLTVKHTYKDLIFLDSCLSRARVKIAAPWCLDESPKIKMIRNDSWIISFREFLVICVSYWVDSSVRLPPTPVKLYQQGDFFPTPFFKTDPEGLKDAALMEAIF